MFLKEYGKSVFGIDAFIMENFTTILLGVVMLTILIVEPHGLARIWQIAKQKLRLWLEKKVEGDRSQKIKPFLLTHLNLFYIA